MLVVMVGLPGSGKTTYAEANFRHVVSPDHIRLQEFGTRFDPAVEREVWKRAYGRTRELLEHGRVVCFDATSVSRTRRRKLVARAREEGKPAVAIWMRVPPETARRRNRARDDAVPEAAFRQLVRAFQPPTPAEGFAAVVEVDGAAPEAPDASG